MDIALKERVTERETSFKIPKAYFMGKWCLDGAVKDNLFFCVTALSRDMTPFCLSEEYKLRDNRRWDESIKITVHLGDSEGFQKIYKRYSEKLYPIYVKEDEGFKVYRPKDVKKSSMIGVKNLLIPPKGFFLYPSFIVCAKRAEQPDGDWAGCTVTQFHAGIFRIEYSFHHEGLSQIKNIDKKVKQLLESFSVHKGDDFQ